MNKSVVVFGSLLILVLTVGCVSTRPAFIKNGKQVYKVSCNGLARSIADCHEAAAQQCDGSYMEVGSDSTNSFTPNFGSGKGYLPVTKRTLMFICN